MKQQPESPEVRPTPRPPAEQRAETVKERALREATLARDMLVPGFLSLILGSDMVGIMGARVYVNTFLGRDDLDPVERILLEQMLVAHHRAIQLQSKAEHATNPESVKILNAASCRLLGEIRRMAGAIKSYRQPPAQKSFQIVKQQNLVANGDQTVTNVSAEKGQESLSVTDELGDNSADAVEGRINGQGNLGKESTAGRSRTAQRAVAAAANT